MLKDVIHKTEKGMSNYKKKDESHRYKEPAPIAPFQCLTCLLYTVVKTLSSIINVSTQKVTLILTDTDARR